MRSAVALTAVMASAAMAGPAGPALAKGGAGGGGGGGGGTPAPSAACANLTVTNNGQTVRNFSMPDVKYNLENCGSSPLNVTVTTTEIDGFLSTLCPSPVAPPASVSLASKQKVSAASPVFRGPCGYTSGAATTLVQIERGWQGHNLLLTATDDATGAVLSSGFFSWQDAVTRP